MKTNKIAVVPGSFDPLTLGHMAVIERASELFDEVWVAVSENAEKKTMYSGKKRVVLAEAATEHLVNVHVELCEGLLSDFAKEKGASYLVKGIRNGSDAEYELELAHIMKRFDAELETIILPTPENLSSISSTYVRELIRYKQDLSKAVPAEIVDLL